MRDGGAEVGSPSSSTGSASDCEYPQRLDARLLRIGGVCLLVSVMTGLDTTIVAVAQRTFVVEFHSTQAVVGWTMAGYILGLATVAPMAGWAADRFGTKRLFMGSVLMFTLGSLLCAMSPNILSLILFRSVQGVGGGALMPLTVTIIRREAGPNRLGRVMAVAAIPMMIAPIFGPILGGWLIRAHGWEWLFLINIPVGLAAFILAALLFPRDESRPSETFDFIGLLLLSPGVATFLYGVSEIPGRGTMADHHVLIPMIIGFALITIFVLHALHRPDHALIDLRLLTNQTVWLANVGLFVYVVAGSVGFLTPSLFQQLMHLTPMEAGLHTIPVALGAMLSIPLAGIFMDRYGPGKIALVGVALVIAGMAIFAYGVATQVSYLPGLVVGMVITGVGSGCAGLPLSGAAVQTLEQNQIARGSTLIVVTELMAGAVGGALMSTLLTNQLNRSANISAATVMATLQQQAYASGLPVDPAAIPRLALAADFTSSLQHDLAHAYAMVFLAAIALMSLAFIPVAFLSKGQVASPSAKTSSTPSG